MAYDWERDPQDFKLLLTVLLPGLILGFVLVPLFALAVSA